ncbi:MAG: cell envelope integrity protein TolA [Thioalkalispiraceae bacterium]|jgi:colicin import membrane protein
MLELFKNNPRFFVGAIIVHVFFLVLFGVGFHFKSQERVATTMPESVKVTTIDEKEVKRELAKLKAQDERELRRKAELQRKRKAEEERLERVKQQRAAEQRKEKQRLALLEKKERELKEKQRKEKQRLAELERKRKQEEERQDRARKEQELKEKMRAEEERMKREQEAAALREAELKKRQTEIDKHMNMIERKVYERWIKPPSTRKGLVSELRVKLLPTGEVIDIELVKSSGDPVYDKSVITAVKSASPLPLPPAETGLFDVFRELHLPMRADQKT